MRKIDYNAFMAVWKQYRSSRCICKREVICYPKYRPNCHIDNLGLGYPNESRYINVETAYQETEGISLVNDIFYSYRFSKEGSPFISLNLCGKYAEAGFVELREKLRVKAEETNNITIIGPTLDNGKAKCMYKLLSPEIEGEWCDVGLLAEAFERLRNIFDQVFVDYLSERKKLFHELVDSKIRDQKVYPLERKVSELQFHDLKVMELDFSALMFPDYQRTYKWGRTQVDQLISDIIVFSNSVKYLDNEEKDAARYRLGTIVMNNNDVVDGQQRLVTISLILYHYWKSAQYRERPDFPHSVVSFWRRIEYTDDVAKGNISQNLELLFERTKDLTEDFYLTLLDKCEFVVIQLPEPSQAFQFFDSQNARGLELKPHDLLKAFHLREIADDFRDKEDGDNIKKWETSDAEGILKDLFLCLYRIKQWSVGNQARYFHRSNVGAFKGLSLKDTDKSSGKNYFPAYDSTWILTQLFKDTDRLDFLRGVEHFPYQIDGTIVNGSVFFEMILHYYKMYNNIRSPKYFEDKKFHSAASIIHLLNTYSQRERRGDIYIREAFDALLLYYIDKYDYFEIDRAVEKIFVAIYGIRVRKEAVFLSTMDGQVLETGLFMTIRNSNTPYDLLNKDIPSVSEDKIQRLPDLYGKFASLYKIK